MSGLRSALSLALAVAALAGGCRGEPPTVRAVGRALLPAPAAAEDRMSPRPACALGDDLRTARGCLATIPLAERGKWRRFAGAPRRPFGVPRRFRGRDMILDRMHRAEKGEPWTHLPPVMIQNASRRLPVSFPGVTVGAAQVRVVASPLGPSVARAESETIAVGPGMMIDGAIGIHPLAAAAGASPTEFVIEAEILDGAAAADAESTGGERVTLLRQRIDPDPGSRGWTDYRVDLAEYEGRRLRFSFSTRPVPADDAGAAVTRSAPLWTTPVLMVPTAPRPNVLLVSLDTLRADFVGAYGSRLPTTPVIDTFAAEGVVFEDALAPFPATTASHMSLMTGTYPSVHGVLGPGVGILSQQLPTLAELLAASGYQTAAFTENGMIIGLAGFARGFRTYREYKRPDRVSPLVTDGHVAEVVSAVLDWIDRHPGDSFFVFAHTYEVHSPYDPQEEFDIFDDDWEGVAGDGVGNFKRQRNRYAGEIRYTDREIGRLLAGLDERGLAESTIVIITSDHGEAFGEHGTSSHGETAYSEAIQIPMLLRAPGLVGGGQRLRAPVSLVDVAPTVLDLIGQPVPDTVQGLSLRAALQGQRDDELDSRTVYAEVLGPRHELVAAHTSKRKWIFGVRDRVPMVFDRHADPSEEDPTGSAEEIEDGRRRVDAFLEDAKRRREAAADGVVAAPEPDDATKTKLRALGYID